MSETRKVLDKAFFDELRTHHHTCYPDHHPLHRQNDCGCKCGRAYSDGKVVILLNGGNYTPDCKCDKRGIPPETGPQGKDGKPE